MIIKISMYVVDFLVKLNFFKIKNMDKFVDNVIFWIFFTTSNILFFGLSYIFGCISQMFIVLMLFNIIRLFSGGYHTSLDKCLTISVPYILSLSLIAKYTANYSNTLYILSTLFGIYIINLIPIMFKEDMKGRSDKYYIKRYIYIFLSLYIINYICLNLDSSLSNLISSSISMAIIGVSLMMKRNKKINYD